MSTTINTNRVLMFLPPELSPMLPPVPGTYIYGTLCDLTGAPAAGENLALLLSDAQKAKINLPVKEAWPVRTIVDLSQEGGHQFGIFPLTPFDDLHGSTYYLPVIYAIIPGPYMVMELDRIVESTKRTLAEKRSNLVSGRAS